MQPHLLLLIVLFSLSVTGVLLVALLRAKRQLRLLRVGAQPKSVEQIATLHAQASRDERERIYNDLHDDIGAKLLSLIHGARTPLEADLARSILQDMRDVVTRSRGTPGTLGDVLADIHTEAKQRLHSVGIGLLWLEADDMPDPALETERALHLHRIVREAISNTIRHAQAHHLRVRLQHSGDQLGIEITDDGDGVRAESAHLGAGMRSMRSRAAELAGDIAWLAGTEGGTKVLLSFPLPPASTAEARP